MPPSPRRATSRPPSRRRRRPQRAARCSSWVTSTSVVPASALSANSSSMIAWPVCGVEVAGGLVGEQQRRAGSRTRAPAPRAAARRRTAGAGSGRGARPGRPAAGSRAPAPSTSRIAAQLQRQHHVLQRGQRGQQLEALEHEADLLAAHARAAVLVQRRQRCAVQHHRCRRWACPGRPAATAACSCPSPTRRRSPPCRRGRCRSPRPRGWSARPRAAARACPGCRRPAGRGAGVGLRLRLAVGACCIGG